MSGKKFFLTAVVCTAFMLGLNGTTSASEVSKDFSTMQVESQALHGHWGNSRRNYPHHPQPSRHHGHYDMGRGGHYQTGREISGRRSGGSVTTIKRSTTRVVIRSRV